jgi:hypothetical protein
MSNIKRLRLQSLSSLSLSLSLPLSLSHSLFPSHPSVDDTTARPYPDAGSLILDIPASRAVKNTYFSIINYSICGIPL